MNSNKNVFKKNLFFEELGVGFNERFKQLQNDKSSKMEIENKIIEEYKLEQKKSMKIKKIKI